MHNWRNFEKIISKSNKACVMNYYVDKAYELYLKKRNTNCIVKTNKDLIIAIQAIERVHRNILWRLVEYFYFIITPINVTIKNSLTIGIYQIEIKLLKKKTKINKILEANSIYTVDQILFDNFTNIDWTNISNEELKDISILYNGYGCEKYFVALQYILRKTP